MKHSVGPEPSLGAVVGTNTVGENVSELGAEDGAEEGALLGVADGDELGAKDGANEGDALGSSDCADANATNNATSKAQCNWSSRSLMVGICILLCLLLLEKRKLRQRSCNDGEMATNKKGAESRLS